MTRHILQPSVKLSKLRIVVLGLQVCRSRIAQVEYQARAQYTRILHSKPLVNTCHGIGCRFELKYFHFACIIFAQC